MAFEGQHGVVAHHAAAVVGNLNQFLSAGLDMDADARGAGVERIFKQFFYHRGRALHHFAGGDLVSHAFR